MQWWIFAETAGDKGGIRLHCHVHIAYVCLCSCMSTVPRDDSSTCARDEETYQFLSQTCSGTVRMV